MFATAFAAADCAAIGPTTATAFVVASGAITPFAEYTVVYEVDGASEPVDVHEIALTTGVPGIPVPEVIGVTVTVDVPAVGLEIIRVETPAPTLLVVI
jgi:hypothetical protein